MSAEYKWPFWNAMYAHDIGFEQIRQVANGLRHETGQALDMPVSLEPILDLARVSVNSFMSPPTDPEFLAEITAIEDDRFIAYLQPGYSLAAERKLISHELAHTFMFLRSPGQKPKNSFEGIFDCHYHKREPERICEEFSRQLLIPREVVDHFNSAEDLAAHFTAPLQLAKMAMRKSSVLKEFTDPDDYFLYPIWVYAHTLPHPKSKPPQQLKLI